MDTVPLGGQSHPLQRDGFLALWPCPMVVYGSLNRGDEHHLILSLATSRQPSPTRTYERVNIGDVGFIREGRFYLLFSAIHSRRKQRGRKLPDSFEKMQWDKNTDTAPYEFRDPGCLHVGATKMIGMRTGVSSPAATQYV